METVPQPERETRRSAGRLVFGLVLLVIGGLLLAGNLGFDVPHGIWGWWPLVLVGLGLVRLLWPGAPDERRSGFSLLVAGIYCSINVWHLFGLDWGTSWPIFVIAAGLSIVTRGFGRRREVTRVS